MRFPKWCSSKALAVVILLGSTLSLFGADQYPKRPLNDRVVVALVAGAALPESIVTDVREHGLRFHPSEQYLSKLKGAGADATVIDAVKQAKVVDDNGAAHTDDKAVLDHLFVASDKLKAKKLMEAASELASASSDIDEYPELAFVMGEIMQQAESFFQAKEVYSRLIEVDPEFPEVHTKLAYVLYKDEESERGIVEARAALARTPSNAEAHKNMALNLEARMQFDAAIAEYQKALAIKPDYMMVHHDLGVLYIDRGDQQNAIVENRKAIALDPDYGPVHHNLGLALQNAGQFGEAIKEFREAIRLEPNDPRSKMALAQALAASGDVNGGVEEFRQIIRTSPDSSYCHRCFAELLYQADLLDEAAKEFRAAIQLDNTDVDAHYGLGRILEKKNQLDEAMKEFQEANKLGGDGWGVHLEMAHIYVARKQNEDALTEIKQALSLNPSNGSIHEQKADILAALGKNDDAILEYLQAFDLKGHDSKEASDVSRKLAAFYEKLGNYGMALHYYRVMYNSFPTQGTRGEYETERKRLSSHLPASALQDEAKATQDNDPQTLVARWSEKSHDTGKAITENHLKDAEEAAKQAIALAEQIQPPDGRLIGSMEGLAQIYSLQKRMEEAEQQYLKSMQTSQKLFGTDNLQTMYTISAVGRFYFEQKNYPQAVEYLTHSFEIAQKLYGQTYGYELLDNIGQAYAAQHMYDRAEAAYKTMLSDDEMKNGPSSPSSAPGLEHLGVLYCDMGKYADAQSALERAMVIDQKQFGANSPSLDRPMTELARALRGLGKEDEAKALDHRRELLAENQPH